MYVPAQSEKDPYKIVLGIRSIAQRILNVPGPNTQTAAYTVIDKDISLIFNGGASITVTLPTPGSYTGRRLRLKTIAAFTVISASGNVVPMAGGAAGTAILAATAGKWADIESDGTNWIIMAAN